MIIRKSPQEIARMRRAGAIVASTIERLIAEVRPGITTLALDRVAEEHMRAQGAIPSFKGYGAMGKRPPFPASICSSLNHEIVHGIPSKRRRLEEGDILKLDVGAIWEGYHGDSAVSVFVGEPPNGEGEKLLRVTEESLEAGIAQLRAGKRLGDVGHAVQQVVEGAGLSVVREFVGHGIGQSLHEDPPIPNFGDPGRGPKIAPGLVVAVEPMVNIGGWETRTLVDEWTVVTADGSLSAHFEHTIAITEDGPEVLTARG